MILAALRLVPLWAYAAAAAVLAGLGFYWHLESVTAERDAYRVEADTANKRVKSLRETAQLLRQLTNESAASADQFRQAKENAETKSSNLAAQLRAGSKRLQVNGQCLRTGSGAGQNGSGADAGTFRLSPDAESAYLRLAAGIDLQRAQVIGLQKRVRSLESRCRIGG